MHLVFVGVKKACDKHENITHANAACVRLCLGG